MRDIIPMPRLFMRATAVSWRMDWRSQSTGADTGGGAQLVANGFPMFVGSVDLVLPRQMVLPFRAIMLRLRGQLNVLRLPMVDPLAGYTLAHGWQDSFRAWQNGTYIEPRPQVRVVSTVAAGAATIVIDETDQGRPVPVGAILSYDDRPFAVVGRSGSGAAVTLTVERLAVAVPANAMIDLVARGLFQVTEDVAGQPDYGTARIARPSFAVREWITR